MPLRTNPVLTRSFSSFCSHTFTIWSSFDALYALRKHGCYGCIQIYSMVVCVTDMPTALYKKTDVEVRFLKALLPSILTDVLRTRSSSRVLGKTRRRIWRGCWKDWARYRLRCEGLFSRTFDSIFRSYAFLWRIRSPKALAQRSSV